jgi:lipoate-protein ligase A
VSPRRKVHTLPEWRLLDTGARSAAENMALDEAILEARAYDVVPNTVRFLQFDPEAVLVGWHQCVDEEVRLEYCQEEGIEVNRRITGGGAIYFDKSQVGWEIVASKKDLDISVVTEELFERICQAAIAGLRSLGVEASFRPRNDIEVDGRKISGTGGTEEKGAFLFQGTLLVDFDAERMIKALRIPTEKLKEKELESVKERVTCLREQLGAVPDTSAVKRAIARGFEEVFNVSLIPSPLSEREETLMCERLESFQSDKWIHKVRSAISGEDTARAAVKGEGGVVRASLKLDLRTRRIKSALITGDFFAFPKRTIFDLEARLKDSSAEVGSATEIVVRFFEENRPEIPGLSASHFVEVITKALQKTEYSKYGLSLGEANSVTTVCGGLEDILGKRIDHLLLPYCSKLTTCDYRYDKECTECGECTVGDGYALAALHGMEAITIVSFEDLMITLDSLKAKGAEGFVGCCCEPFYVKHADDFENAGLPGILTDIDNNTCYDLGKERDAYLGKFESQTHLHLPLLEKILLMIGGRKTAIVVGDDSAD